MVYLSNIPVSFVLLASCLTRTEASPIILNDDTVRSLSVTPVLGRGYSLITDTYLSTCLDVEETTVPSYNYDYTFTDLTRSVDLETDLEVSMGASLTYKGVNAEVESSFSLSTKTSLRTYVVLSTLRVDRYYSSLQEHTSPLVEDAKTLLGQQDYVGFYKACGSYYVRSIRRSSEVTAIFKFKSTSTNLAAEFAASLKAEDAAGQIGSAQVSVASKAKFKSLNQSLTIKIVGFGLGLNQDGDGTLVATSVEGYNDVMKFAFSSMTRNDSYNVGMIQEIEVAPWAENVGFQVEAKIQDDPKVPVTSSLIPQATDSSGGNFVIGTSNRADFNCADASHVMDKIGYCCESTDLYNPAVPEYDDSLPEERICRPLRAVDKTKMQDIMTTNGEFVVRLDQALRNKFNQISVLERCISSANDIPTTYDEHVLKKQSTAQRDVDLQEAKYTLAELKRVIDPFGDYSLVRHMTHEVDEYMDMYYTPCLTALYSDDDRSQELNEYFFLDKKWSEHQECSIQYGCLTNNKRWDRANGGCHDSLYTGQNAATYGTTFAKCSTKPDLSCKYDNTELKDYHSSVTDCWNDGLPDYTGSVDYFINHYCAPRVTSVTKTSVPAICTLSSRRRLKENRRNSRMTKKKTDSKVGDNARTKTINSKVGDNARTKTVDLKADTNMRSKTIDLKADTNVRTKTIDDSNVVAFKSISS